MTYRMGGAEPSNGNGVRPKKQEQTCEEVLEATLDFLTRITEAYTEAMVLIANVGKFIDQSEVSPDLELAKQIVEFLSTSFELIEYAESLDQDFPGFK